MKISEFLSSNVGNNKVFIYDCYNNPMFAGHIYEAVKRFGDLTLKDWKASDDNIRITTCSFRMH